MFSVFGTLVTIAAIRAWSHDGWDDSFSIPTMLLIAGACFAVAFGWIGE